MDNIILETSSIIQNKLVLALLVSLILFQLAVAVAVTVAVAGVATAVAVVVVGGTSSTCKMFIIKYEGCGQTKCKV